MANVPGSDNTFRSGGGRFPESSLSIQRGLPRSAGARPRLSSCDRRGARRASANDKRAKGFIRAEIISFADFLAAGGEAEAKRAGKLRLELKQYVMQDYDLANFRFKK